MQILSINCGSSSVKAALYEADLSGSLSLQKKRTVDGLAAGSHKEAIPSLLSEFSGNHITAIAHRITHGADFFSAPELITDAVMAKIEKCREYAPLHNPINILGVESTREIFPGAAQVACFDTAFHQSIQLDRCLYGIPFDLYKKHNIRRFGFHGLSHSSAALSASIQLGKPAEKLSLITCHLGAGCSLCAIEDGKSVDTTMGFTPLEGLVMATRSGSIDPGALLALMEQEKLDIQGASALLNRKSGLLGLSGKSADMRTILQDAHHGDEQAMLARDVFVTALRKHLGAMAAALTRRPDAIIFTGGIGENSPEIRQRALDRLAIIDAEIDRAKNQERAPDIATERSRTRVLIVPADEERALALDAFRLLNKSKPAGAQ